MNPGGLLSNRKVSRLFFELVRGRAQPSALAERCGLGAEEGRRLIDRMQRAGLARRGRGGVLEVDWERFLPLFVSRAMNIYTAAMPFKYVPYYLDRDPEHVIEAACARAERELAKVKVKLADSERFAQLVQRFFESLAGEVDAPEEYLADMRIQDAVEEFEYALLKLYPLVRQTRGKGDSARRLMRLLGDWYRQIQAYDNTPTGAALRAAFRHAGLLAE